MSNITDYPSNTISMFTDSMFPSFMGNDGSLLLKFVEYYFEWLSEIDGAIDVNRKILQYNDIDTVPDKFMHFLRNEFMKSIPAKTGVDERFLLKHIKDFYKAKGSELAYRLLFRILYNEQISFYYPGRDILRASDGRWVIDRSIKVNMRPGVVIDDNRTLLGTTSGTTATFLYAYNYVDDGVEITEFFFDKVFGEFLPNEFIVYQDDPNIILGMITPDGQIEYGGRFDGTFGFLSSDKYLQDNFYYQEYSYQINSNRSFDQYEQILKNTVHPVGTKAFGAIESVTELPGSAVKIITTDEILVIIDETIIRLPFTVENEHASVDDIITVILYFENILDYMTSEREYSGWTFIPETIGISTHTPNELLVTQDEEGLIISLSDDPIKVVSSEHVVDYDLVYPVEHYPVGMLSSRRIIYSDRFAFIPDLQDESILDIRNVDGWSVTRRVDSRLSNTALLINDSYVVANNQIDASVYYSNNFNTGANLYLNTHRIGQGTITITTSPNTTQQAQALELGITMDQFFQGKVVIGSNTNFYDTLDAGDVIQVNSDVDESYIVSKVYSQEYLVIRDQYLGTSANGVSWTFVTI